jgi:hypothetical protein
MSEKQIERRVWIALLLLLGFLAYNQIEQNGRKEGKRIWREGYSQRLSVLRDIAIRDYVGLPADSVGKMARVKTQLDLIDQERTYLESFSDE